MKILDELKDRRLFFDGGMGSLLQAKGLKPGELPETWNVLHPEIIEQIHMDYLNAGADVVTTNTFGVNRFKDNKEESVRNFFMEFINKDTPLSVVTTIRKDQVYQPILRELCPKNTKFIPYIKF